MYMLWFEGHIMHCFPPLHKDSNNSGGKETVGNKSLVYGHLHDIVHGVHAIWPGLEESSTHNWCV